VQEENKIGLKGLPVRKVVNGEMPFVAEQVDLVVCAFSFCICLSNIRTKSFSFACAINSIEGKPIFDRKEILKLRVSGGTWLLASNFRILFLNTSFIVLGLNSFVPS